ncbi:hypothetical protein [Rufibacter ruber]|uniref:hypothetical protein n=1 Tax=Rufibacter ruber TaxID=1783499 RepID=UPI00128FE3C5|nr:hypothetical protein [Rufibacter ruber]
MYSLYDEDDKEWYNTEVAVLMTVGSTFYHWGKKWRVDLFAFYGDESWSIQCREVVGEVDVVKYMTIQHRKQKIQKILDEPDENIS